MSVITLHRGDSVNLSTGHVTRTPVSHREPVHMFRTPAALRNNNLNALRNVFTRPGH